MILTPRHGLIVWLRIREMFVCNQGKLGLSIYVAKYGDILILLCNPVLSEKPRDKLITWCLTQLYSDVRYEFPSVIADDLFVKSVP